MLHHAVYGLTVASDFPFSWPLVRSDRPADVYFVCESEAPVEVDWDANAPVHAVAVHGDGPDLTYHRVGEVDVVRVRGAADHYLFEDRIVCHLHDPALEYLAEIQLFGMVLALWLERHGVPALHASCAVINDRAVAFLGTKGGGKTTAVAALLAAGYELLADDLLALQLEHGRVMAQPGYPLLRLWPDQAEHFLGRHDHLPLVHPSFSKRRVVVGAGWGAFHAAPAMLDRIYLPLRSGPGQRAGREVLIEPVRSSDALIAMIRESYLREAVHGLGLAGARLAQLAQVLCDVQVRVLRYDSGFEHLTQMVVAVQEDVVARSR